VIDPSKSIADVPEWFKGSRLNYAENLLKHEENDKIALYAARESPMRIFVIAGCYLPNGIHAVEAMLAAASIGAIWSATSPDFGINVTCFWKISLERARETTRPSWNLSSSPSATHFLSCTLQARRAPRNAWCTPQGITILGTGAKWLAVLEEKNLKP
ncbi:Acetoacetyl-CoA synthetase, partial [Ophiophagus hannah]